MTTPENSPHQAEIVFKRTGNRVYKGGLVVTLPIDAQTIEFMNTYDEYTRKIWSRLSNLTPANRQTTSLSALSPIMNKLREVDLWYRNFAASLSTLSMLRL